MPQCPLPDWVWHDDVLTSAACFLADLHRAGDGFGRTGAVWRPPRDRRLTGVIDWDMASPGPRVRDLSYLAYRLVPLTASENPDGPLTASCYQRE